MFSENMLSGKVAMVTGANQGLGFAMAEGLAQHGADIYNVGIGDDTKIRERIESLGRKYMYCEQDLSKPSKAIADELVACCVEKMGKIDILLNNAGANKRVPFVEVKEEDWDFILNLNLKNVFLLSQSVVNHMIQHQIKGKIIHIASMLSFTGGIYVPAYTASKSGVMGLTKAMANECSIHGINVNAIAPGYMDTPLTKAMQDDPIRNSEIMSRLPAGYWGKPEVLKGPVVFLASEESNYVCGCTMNVDGGWLSR